MKLHPGPAKLWKLSLPILVARPCARILEVIQIHTNETLELRVGAEAASSDHRPADKIVTDFSAR